ncbi:MAG: Ig-like domain-containing protein [Bacteroidaceae bacterium]|nr:Ig-like domain-containing protein [Bacteroidaceae bacterium]
MKYFSTSKQKILPVLFSFILAACASIGSPDGGPYDETPPRVVQCTPANKATENTKKKVSILFDEYIKMENASEKVVVSPPQIEMPNIRAIGKRVKVDLFDSLQANTTYTIDFSDAIVDNNEGNPLGKYTFSFSTGPDIDTMEVSGTVLNAENLEPIKGILVGLYAADTTFHDTLFRTHPLIRVARTNGSGQFTVKGVKPGQYHAYALQDMDGNYRFSQKSEMLAFDTTTIITSQRPDIRPDTVWTVDSMIEKIRMVPFIHYFPDNLVLRAFLESGQDKHLLKTERKTPESFTLYFTAPQDSLPHIEGIGFDADRVLLPEPSLHNDTITYWITDTLVSYPDTISFHLTYLDTDTLGNDVLHTDSTMELVSRTSHAKLEKERQKKAAEWKKEREKKIKRSKTVLPDEENPYEITYMTYEAKPSGSIDPNQNVTLTFSEPIAMVNMDHIHFYEKVDTEYVEAPFLLRPVEGEVRRYRLFAEWEAEKRYRFEADSLAFLGVLGHYAQSIRNDLRVRSLDEYGAIFVRLVGIEHSDSAEYIVQLLNKSDKPVAQMTTDQNGRADFFYLKPGEYYMRLIVDRNANGKWDTGEYDSMTPPEEVFYFPRLIPLKAKFEMEQDWNFRSISLTQQKPVAITKQKADKEKTVMNKNRQRELDKQRNGK